MKITTIGIDLAKSVFQVHGVDQRGKPVVLKRLRRKQMLPYFAQLSPCLVGMEACGGARYWARKLRAQGHSVKLMAPQFVKPYVKANKTDAADAEAICEAVTRPSMRFVPIKNGDQQAVLSLHRVRQGFVKARTAQANQIRGLLAEYGITLPQGISHVANRLPEIVEDAENDLPGIGPLTASALSASIGDAKCFNNGRELAAWLGLVPRQHSSGGKSILLGISKRGDAYLRTLMIHGARSVIRVAERKTAPTDSWSTAMMKRRHSNVAAVARANKNARVVWVLLVHGREYSPDYKQLA